MTTADIIQLTPSSRLRVDYDEDASNPREDGDAWITGVVNVHTSRRSGAVPEVHYNEPGLAHAHERAPYLPNGRGGAKVSIPEFVTRWARIFHDLTVEWDRDLGAYWFISKEGLEAAGLEQLGEDEARDIITQEKLAYDAWVRGDVYRVELERRVGYIRADRIDADFFDRADFEPDISIWEGDGESLSGCYLDDEYSAQAVAAEHFTLTEAELEACK